jgi:23S rRNA pseudouridine1911/1915/1917 synthase
MSPTSTEPRSRKPVDDDRPEFGDEVADFDAVVERLAWMVEADEHGERFDKVLARRAVAFSRSHLQALIALGHASIDDRVVVRPARTLECGQRVCVELVPTAKSRSFRAEPMPLSIVHEDDDLLVIAKPAGLVVHPAAGHWSGTLMNGVLAHHAGAFDLPRAGLVHRLDKDTSGLMVVAKNLPAMTALVRALAARELRREYLALVHGRPIEPSFTVDAPMLRDPVSRVRMVVRADGKSARTDFECVATLDRVSDDSLRAAAVGGARTATTAVSALRCRLHTGRTHQIRVHLASRGMPLVADPLYGGAPALGMTRQALHAARLAFVHPSRGVALDFAAPAPADFQAAWRVVAPGYNPDQI